MKYKSPLPKILVFLLLFSLFCLFLTGKAPVSRTPCVFWFDNVEILIEIDSNFNNNLSHFKQEAEQIFASFGANATFLFSQELNISNLTLSYSNVSQFAVYSNQTKSFSHSIHLLVVESFISNGVSIYWGLAPRSSLWYSAFQDLNMTAPSFTSGIIASSTILNQTGDSRLILKVILHELGHLLGCGHSTTGIMKQGIISDFFYSGESLSQMNFERIWTRDIGFSIYS